MNLFLVLTLLFFTGSIIGWVLELFFRHYVLKDKKWINPGFLAGPYLPIYGFGICVLFLLALLEPHLPFYGGVAGKIILFLTMALMMTVIEYIAGEIFIIGLKTKLWDYSNERFNIKGIVCLKYSVCWGILGIFYYYVLHPAFSALIKWYSVNLTFSFVLGMLFGIFVIDAVFSFNLVAKIRSFAVENDILVRYEELKLHIRKASAKPRRFKGFVFALHSDITLKEQLIKYRELLNAKKPRALKHNRKTGDDIQ